MLQEESISKTVNNHILRKNNNFSDEVGWDKFYIKIVDLERTFRVHAVGEHMGLRLGQNEK